MFFSSGEGAYINFRQRGIRLKISDGIFLLEVFEVKKIANKIGGERGIRTPERVAPLTVFETAAFGHSAISPQ